MAEIVQSVKNQDKRTQVELVDLLMNKTKKDNSVHLLQMGKTCRGRPKNGSSWVFEFLERECVPSL